MNRKRLAIGAGLLLIAVVVGALAWFSFQRPMFGGFAPTFAQAVDASAPLSIEQVEAAVMGYLDQMNNSDLIISEVMAFDNHFYASVEEKSTGIHAIELLVDGYSGRVVPEPGPNMMWNGKYGHMKMPSFGGMWGHINASTDMLIPPDQARQIAQRFLDQTSPGTVIDEQVDHFYGYYTLHVERDDSTIGMLSVNGQNGQVWVHSWHGEFLGMKRLD